MAKKRREKWLFETKVHFLKVVQKQIRESSSLFLLPVVEKNTADEEPFSSSYFVRPCFSKSDALNKQFLGIDDGR